MSLAQRRWSGAMKDCASRGFVRKVKDRPVNSFNRGGMLCIDCWGLTLALGTLSCDFQDVGAVFCGSLGVSATAGGCILACFELRIILASFSCTCHKIHLRNEIISSENVHLASGSVGCTG